MPGKTRSITVILAILRIILFPEGRGEPRELLASGWRSMMDGKANCQPRSSTDSSPPELLCKIFFSRYSLSLQKLRS